MAKPKEFPDEGELVVGTVRNVQGFGAFITLEEYPGKEGFIHIAEVSSGWVKRIRDFVREQQRVVCKVLGVDRGKGHVDLSLKRVNEHQRREKIQDWKNEQKADKLLEIVGERMGIPKEKCYEDFGFELMEAYGSLYSAFEAAAVDLEALSEAGFKGEWVTVVSELAAENIAMPFVDIKGFVELHAWSESGVDDIKKALQAAEKGEFEDVDIKVQYIGAPNYLISIRAPDYKIAEDELKKAAERAIQVITKTKGQGAYHRELASKKAAA